MTLAVEGTSGCTRLKITENRETNENNKKIIKCGEHVANVFLLASADIFRIIDMIFKYDSITRNTGRKPRQIVAPTPNKLHITV